MNNNWLEYIYKHLHKESYLWARQCCSYNDEHAKEVMQLVYLKLLEGKARYDNKAKIKTWLFSVIKFTAFGYLKSLSTPFSIENLPFLLVDNTYEENENKEDYQGILSRLPERQHQVLLLVFYHGLTLQEAAEVLNISIGSIRTHYDRGKKKLKILLVKEKYYET